MKIAIPEKVNFIIETLQSRGYEAYAVGGCVRDSILGRVPDDWDITTSAMPEETKALFARTFDTGIEHGTITVVLEREGFEVTTYRVDGEYEDSRHPKEVTFTRSLEEDLLRRDFTINAMAYNDKDGLVDIFGGVKDLEKGIIRCVGNATDRFSEDALRILRAVRFAAQLGFEIEEETREGIRRLAPTLANISAERIQTELVKLLVSPNPGMIWQAYEMGITAVVLPEFDHLQEKEEVIQSLEQIRADKVLRLALLLQSVGEEGAKAVLRRLKFDNDTLRKVSVLVRYQDYRPENTQVSVRKAICLIGEDLFPLFLEAQGLDHIRECYEGILERKECVSLKTLALNGNDLIANGMKPGKEIGEELQRLLEIVLEHPEYNTKETLLSLKKNHT